MSSSSGIGAEHHLWLAVSVEVFPGPVFIEHHVESARAKYHTARAVVDSCRASVFDFFWISYWAQGDLITIPELLFVRRIVLPFREAGDLLLRFLRAENRVKTNHANQQE
jgi:hypothetical protein